MNKWIQLGQKQMVAPHKARLRAAKTRAERKRDKQLDDRETLFRQWQKWHLDRKKELLSGAYAEAANELAGFLERMTIEDAGALVELVGRGPWRACDRDTRFLITDLISHAITYLRERDGLDPFDDPIDDDTNAFLTIREILR